MQDDYELGNLLGRGGMGEVHIARHKSGRIVAIKHVRKTLSLDPLLCERLGDEARILRRISHPNVVGVLDGGVNTDGQPYLVMARAFGTPLDTVIAKDGAFSRERITGVMTQFLDGMIAIHDAGVIHADLKSSNVLIDELDRVTIIDFGLARIAPCSVDDDEIFGGTPAYMAPELLGGGAPSIAADIFAAGVIAYELLTGAPPLARHLPAMVLLSLRMHEPAELPSKRAPDRAITEELDTVLAKALARDPKDRYATVREFYDELAQALADWEPSFEDVPTSHRRTIATPANLAPTIELATAADHVIDRALTTTSALVATRDIEGGIMVLEEALAQLMPRDPAIQIVAEAWRLETVLAALYQSVGKKDHANRVARVAYQHAQRANCRVAVARSSALISQLAQGQARIARGSQQVPVGPKKKR